MPARPPRPAPTDEGLQALARLARRGDTAAFERLVIETAPVVHALALRLVGDEQDARDLVQETFLRAYRSIGRFRSEAAVTTWLYRITANCAATHLRRHHPALPLEAALALADETVDADPERCAAHSAERASLAAALAALPSSLRSVVVLHDVYELTHDVVAAELGISRAASKVRLHRARRRLREQLFPERRAHGEEALAEGEGTVAPLGASRAKSIGERRASAG